jgi:hypothetical protein
MRSTVERRRNLKFSKILSDFRTRHLAKENRKEVLDMSYLFGWLVSVEPLLDSGVHRVNSTPTVTQLHFHLNIFLSSSFH